MKFNVFNLGYDLWLWESPYSLSWNFHHPEQNIDKPDDTDSIVIVVKNDNSKIVGLQNIKWNDKGQTIYKNTIAYKYVKVYDFEIEGVIITQSLVLEHEIVEITPENEKNLFKTIKREHSQIRDLKNIEFSLEDDFVFSLFKNYSTNIYEVDRYGTGPVENNRPIEWEGVSDEDFFWINEYGEECHLPLNDLIDKIYPKFENNGNLKKLTIRKPEPETIDTWPYQIPRQGISEIDISYDYFADKSTVPIEINIGCCIDNLIYSGYRQEKVNYHFDSIGDLSIFIPGPKSSSVLLYDDNILVWKYNYNEENRLCKMTLNDTLENVLYNFTIEYRKTNNSDLPANPEST